MASNPLPEKVKSALALISQEPRPDGKYQVLNGATDEPCEAVYSKLRVIGNGSFGAVCMARDMKTNETIAIKIVYQDKRFKNRELQIMKMTSHQNIVALREYFYRTDRLNEDVYLNLVLEYLPDTVFNASQNYIKHGHFVPHLHVKLYIYQLLRALAYLHSLGICHRDIKPQNLLLDPASGTVKLCDFGSAKMLVSGEINVSYICSRYYRAPELLTGSCDYTTAVDIWSAGCVMAELLIGSPLFPGNNDVDQLVQIFRLLGTPTHQQMLSVNPNYRSFRFPSIKPSSWDNIFATNRPSDDAVDLLNRLLDYLPSNRISAFDALAHPYFDELRLPATMYAPGRPLPDLFNFSPAELLLCSGLEAILIPPHVGQAKAQLASNSDTLEFCPNILQVASHVERRCQSEFSELLMDH